MTKPNQPAVSNIPIQRHSSRTFYFQNKWFQEHPWLHYSPDLKKVICFYCSKANVLGLDGLARCKEPAFILNGFNNWKKGPEKFNSHQNSRTHQLAVDQISAIKRTPVNALINSQKQKEQENSRKSLLKIFTSVRYLLRQGLAFRGHEEIDGNFRSFYNLDRKMIWL